MVRWCARCKEETSNWGKASYCRPCWRDYYRAHRREKPWIHRAAHKKHWETSEYRKVAKRMRAKIQMARKRGALGQPHAKDMIEHFKKLGNRCFYCPGPFEEVDHVIPIKRGGTNELSNLVPSCRRCNRLKSDRALTRSEMRALL